MNHLASDRWILRKINEHFDDTLEKDGKGILRIHQYTIRMEMTGAMKKTLVGWVI